MIEIVKYPKTVDLARNNCGMIVKGTNFYINQGQKGSFQIHMPANLPLCTIHVPALEFGTILIFTVVATPNDGGFQLKLGSTAEETAIQFRLNYKLSKYFNVWYDGAGIIKFETWDKGDYIVNEETAFIVESPVTLTLSNRVSGIAPVYNQGYKIFYLLLIERDYMSGVFESIEFFGDADLNGELPIHLSFIKSYFIGRDLPAVNLNTYPIANFTVKRYKLSIAEYYSDILRRLLETEVLYMLSAKIDPIDYPGLNLPDLITSTKTYLKNGLDIIKSTDATQQYLYFMAPTNYTGQLYIKTEKFFDDGVTPNEVVNKNVVAGLNQYQIIIIPVGFKALGFDAHAKAENIYKYQVSLLDVGNNVIGRLMTYYVRPHNERDLVFLYENRFGVFDTLIATGEIQRKHNISNKIHQKYLPLDYVNTDTELISENKDDFPTFKVNTGSYTLNLAIEIEAMLSANYFYKIENNQYKRCMLKKSSNTVSDSIENLYSVEFEYQFAIR